MGELSVGHSGYIFSSLKELHHFRAIVSQFRPTRFGVWVLLESAVRDPVYFEIDLSKPLA